MNQIYNVDCIEFMKTIKSDSIDLILTDPPYGISYRDNIRKSRYWSKKNNKTYKNKSPKLVIEKVTNDMKGAIDWQLFLDESFRILKPHKMIYLFCRKDVAMDWGYYIRNSGFKYVHDVLWIKGDMGYGNLNVMGMIHETIIGLSMPNLP